MGLLFRGDHDFQRVGPAQWQPNGWELDRLTVPYKGSIEYVDAFIAGLVLWSSSSIDGNMFLVDWTSDGHPAFPTVELVYIGKKGGNLPPDRDTKGETIQQVRFTSFPSLAPEVLTIDLTYIGPTSSRRTWSRAPIEIADVSPPAPPDVTGIWFTAHWEETTPSPALDSIPNALEYFIQVEVETGDSEEVVPGQYYVGTAVKTNMLHGTQA